MREGSNLNCCMHSLYKVQRLETCNLIYLPVINLSNIQYIWDSVSPLIFNPFPREYTNVNHRELLHVF